jgi:hypothetical protein
MNGQHLDIASPGPALGASSVRHESSRFVGIHFVCCDVYSRVYANRERTAYVGHCPRCAKRVSLKIGPGGTDSRFFTAQ